VGHRLGVLETGPAAAGCLADRERTVWEVIDLA
jgi:hypothetical protein